MGSRTRQVAALLLVAASSLAVSRAAAGGDECFYCGMRRSDFGHSWVEIRYLKEPVLGFCSLHCATIHLALHPEKVPAEILVGDYLSHLRINADSAHWVIGGRKPGVMTTRAKWAFASKADAVRFVAQNGGRLATMVEATRAAVDDMYRDIRVIQKKREDARTKAMDRNREQERDGR